VDKVVSVVQNEVRKILKPPNQRRLLHLIQVWRIIVQKGFRITVHIMVSGRRYRLKVVRQMYDVPVLAIHPNKVLILFVLFDVGDALLEVECISHQIEKQ